MTREGKEQHLRGNYARKVKCKRAGRTNPTGPNVRLEARVTTCRSLGHAPVARVRRIAPEDKPGMAGQSGSYLAWQKTTPGEAGRSKSGGLIKGLERSQPARRLRRRPPPSIRIFQYNTPITAVGGDEGGVEVVTRIAPQPCKGTYA